MTSCPCPPPSFGAQPPFPLLPCFASSSLFRTRRPASPSINLDRQQGCPPRACTIPAPKHKEPPPPPPPRRRKHSPPTHYVHKSRRRVLPPVSSRARSKVTRGAWGPACGRGRCEGAGGAPGRPRLGSGYPPLRAGVPRGRRAG